MGERGGHWQSGLGQQGGGAGEGRQIPGRAVQPERRGETALPDGPAIKGRNTSARLPPRFPAPGKCTSHLGFGLGVAHNQAEENKWPHHDGSQAGRHRRPGRRTVPDQRPCLPNHNADTMTQPRKPTTANSPTHGPDTNHPRRPKPRPEPARGPTALDTEPREPPSSPQGQTQRTKIVPETNNPQEVHDVERT